MNYYNDTDRYCQDWLANLIAAKLIPPGDIDPRPIQDVRPYDLASYTQCHFFAGIAGWPLALRLAGVPPDRPLWTGSCPCQSFSTAGKRRGTDDERHLWPYWHHLIEQCRPPAVFGEQVASPDGLDWADLVQDDMEDAGYAFGKSDLCAAGVGAPHIRQRLYWVADSECNSRVARRFAGESAESLGAAAAGAPVEFGRCGVFGGLAESGSARAGWDAGSRAPAQAQGDSQWRPDGIDASHALVAGGAVCRMEHAARQQVGIPGCAREPRGSFWSLCDWLPCTDGKSRPVEPGTFPLAHGVFARVGKLRAYGNAIVPQVAATFIRAYLDRLEAGP